MARRKKEVVVEEAPLSSLVEPRKNERLSGLAAVALRFKAWKPAREVLTKVEAVPTIFPQFDRGTRVGGLPLARFTVVHGPSNNGKTVFTTGLGLSFLQRDHFFGLVDAENTTPIDWLEKLMGGYEDHPGFHAMRPSSYEETVDGVRSFLTQIGEAREKGEIPKETTGLVVVDSIRKLVPQNILAKILKAGAEGEKGSIDGMGGRAAQIKAALNAAWLDEVTMLLHQTNTSMIVIARETDDPNADANDKKWGNDWHITGGKALIFDSSLIIRITRQSWVKAGSGDDDKQTIGERHKARIWKTKVGQKDDKHTDCFFHTSNGKLVPEGYDRARDVLELAKKYEVVKAPKGAWLSWNSNRWQGENAAVRKLTEEPAKLAELEAEVRARFSPDEDIAVEGEEEE